MQSKWWLCLCTAVILALSGAAVADEHGHGHGKHHDRDEIRGWYHDHGDHLPPGLAKRHRLPPGLERQLRVSGTLPPGLRKKMVPCPVELERRLPPPPPGYGNFAIGGHIVLVNRSNFLVLDVFHVVV